MTLYPYVQERLLSDRRRELERAHRGTTSSAHHEHHLLGHQDPFYTGSGRMARMVSWAPASEAKTRAAFRLAVEGVACWESCNLAPTPPVETAPVAQREVAAEPDPAPTLEGEGHVDPGTATAACLA